MDKETLYTLRWFIKEGWGEKSLQPGAERIIDMLIDGHVSEPEPEARHAPTPVVKAVVVEPVAKPVVEPVAEPVAEPVIPKSVPEPIAAELATLRQLRGNIAQPGHLVCIDAGHGGSDSGAVNRKTGLKEKHVNLTVARLVKSILENNFCSVVMTRDSDVYLPLPARADIANRANVDAFISIHCNDADNKQANGIETFYKGCEPLASGIQQQLASIPGHINRGIKKANFSVLRRTAAPAALVECEFINHPEMGTWLSTRKAEDELALAIAHGILIYLQNK